MRRASVFLSILVAAPLGAAVVEGPFHSSPLLVQVGHWVEARGQLRPDGVFVAEEAEILHPEEHDLLVGTISPDGARRHRFVLLGQPIETTGDTEWQGVDLRSPGGQRVKVEGSYHHAGEFIAVEVTQRGEGRDHVGGRVEEVRRTASGIEARILRFWVILPPVVDHGEPLTSYPLAPARAIAPIGSQVTDEEDQFGRGISVGATLRLTGQLELEAIQEQNFDLDDEDAEDRTDLVGSARARLEWSPYWRLGGILEVRGEQLRRDDEEEGRSSESAASLGQTWLGVADALGAGADLYVGRQDFDDQREWIYDQNLDALRLVVARASWRLQLSAATTLSDGSDRDEAATNLIAYLSNNREDRRLAAWAVRREFDLSPKEETLHLGVSAFGEWLPTAKSWLDAALLRGSSGFVDLEGWGFDLGTTWRPRALGLVSFTVSYAFGTGDDDPAEETDGTFRQTGLQDNNDKFGGVTSFRYYGELVEPELANLRIATAGIGLRVAPKTSLDVVYHEYRQDEPSDRWIDAELDRHPDGVHPDLGWEVDLVFGSRRWPSLDLEVVAGHFRPGAAFDLADEASLGRIQVRYRF